MHELGATATLTKIARGIKTVPMADLNSLALIALPDKDDDY